MSAVNLGAEAIMDLSSHGNTQPFRQKLTSECPAMIGTVPVYDSVIHYQRDLSELTAKDFCGCCTSARTGRSRFCDAALRNYKKDDRSDQEA